MRHAGGDKQRKAPMPRASRRASLVGIGSAFLQAANSRRRAVFQPHLQKADLQPTEKEGPLQFELGPPAPFMPNLWRDRWGVLHRGHLDIFPNQQHARNWKEAYAVGNITDAAAWAPYHSIPLAGVSCGDATPTLNRDRFCKFVFAISKVAAFNMGRSDQLVFSANDHKTKQDWIVAILHESQRTFSGKASSFLTPSPKVKELGLTFLAFLHPVVATATFNLFNCEHVPGYPLDFLKLDYSIQCGSLSWFFFLALAFSLGGFFIVALPFGLAIRMYRARAKLIPLGVSVKHDYILWYGRFYHLTPEMVKELITQMRRDSGVPVKRKSASGVPKLARRLRHAWRRATNALTGQGTDLPPAYDSDDEGDPDLTNIIGRYGDARAEWNSLAFMHGDYKPAFFYWDVVEMIRRLLLTSFIIMVAQYTPGFDIISGLLFSAIFMLLQSGLLPYKSDAANSVKFWIQVAEFMTLFILLCLTLTPHVLGIYLKIAPFGIIVINGVALFMMAYANERKLQVLFRTIKDELTAKRFGREHAADHNAMLRSWCGLVRVVVLLRRRRNLIAFKKLMRGGLGKKQIKSADEQAALAGSKLKGLLGGKRRPRALLESTTTLRKNDADRAAGKIPQVIEEGNDGGKVSPVCGLDNLNRFIDLTDMAPSDSGLPLSSSPSHFHAHATAPAPILSSPKPASLTELPELPEPEAMEGDAELIDAKAMVETFNGEGDPDASAAAGVGIGVSKDPVPTTIDVYEPDTTTTPITPSASAALTAPSAMIARNAVSPIIRASTASLSDMVRAGRSERHLQEKPETAPAARTSSLLARYGKPGAAQLHSAKAMAAVGKFSSGSAAAPLIGNLMSAYKPALRNAGRPTLLSTTTPTSTTTSSPTPVLAKTPTALPDLKSQYRRFNPRSSPFQKIEKR